MSLINDALKRAKEAQKQAPPPAPAAEGLQPIESQPSGFRPTSLIVPALIVIMAAAGWYLLRGTPSTTPSHSNAGATASSPTASEPAGVASAPVIRELTEAKSALQAKAALNEEVKAVVASESSSSPSPAKPDASAAQPASNPLVEHQAAVVPQSKPEVLSASQTPSPSAGQQTAVQQPHSPATVSASTPGPVDISSLQLQGIHFRLKNPSVMINNRVLKVGDTIEGFRIVRIQRNSVFVEGNGTTKELLLR